MRARRGTGARGFTLLEVMAAVLVLGMLYAVLATAAVQGLRSEGASKRRIQASLLADSRLSDLELELALGQVPKSGQTEEKVEEYVVDVVAKPLDATILLAASEALAKKRPKRVSHAPQKQMGTGGSSGAGAQGAGAQGAAAQAAAAAGLGGGQAGSGLGGTPGAQVDPAAAALGESLLLPQGPGQEGRLRQIDVVVRWQEGVDVREVTRTTFAFDTSGLEQMFPQKGEANEPPNEDEARANEIEQMLKSLGGGGGGAGTPNETPDGGSQ